MNFNFAIILNTSGIFGGAEKRFTNLFRYLYEKYPGNSFYFVSNDLFDKIKNIYPDYPLDNVIPIGKKEFYSVNKKSVKHSSIKISRHNSTTDIFFLRKLYRWMKSYKKQYFLYREIDKYRKEYKINVFMGVYSGILPLYFYLKKRKRKIGIIFSDMDSWFDDVYSDMRKYWYKTYNSFNYALENADIVDFLSPFILDGVKKKGITIPEEKISITPCSFTDYSKCKIGNKREFQIAFSGRLEGDKNPLLFVEAARLLLQKYPDLIFHIIGEGRLGSNIREKVEGFDNIIYHGFHISPTDILAESSVFVSIQSTNNYPSQSVLEAMACGNAIIATDVGDTRMFINKNNGILINLELNELVNAIGSLYLDKILRERLGKYAFSYVREKHSLEKSAEYYITLFNKTSLRYID